MFNKTNIIVFFTKMWFEFFFIIMFFLKFAMIDRFFTNAFVFVVNILLLFLFYRINHNYFRCCFDSLVCRASFFNGKIKIKKIVCGICFCFIIKKERILQLNNKIRNKERSGNKTSFSTLKAWADGQGKLVKAKSR